MKGIYVLGAGLAGVARSLAPDELKGMSPLWASDLDSLEPWVEVDLPSAIPRARWWRSGSAPADGLIVIAGPCSSSLDLSWVLSRKGLLPEWGSLLAVSQWSGRGRQGRVWHSPAGNVYAALRLPDPAPQWLDLMPLVTAYLLIEALGEMCLDLKIKWPNDIMLKGRKLGGILIEQQGDSIMAGVGINLASAPEMGRLRNEQGVPACCLADVGCRVTPLGLWRHLLGRVRILYAGLMAGRSPSLLPPCVEKHLAFINEDVVVDPPGEQAYRATVLGVDARGGLKVRAGGKDRVIRRAGIYPVAD